MKKYKKYKPSGIKWIGNIPEHWKVMKLKYIIEIKSGDGILNIEMDEEGKFPIYGGNGIMNFTFKTNSDEIELIIGRVGAHCGNIHLSSEKKWISDNALRVKTTENWQFMYNLLSVINLNSLSSQNAQPLITGFLVKNQTIGCPPRPEQTKIANYLDKKTTQIDQTLKQKEKLIELYKEEKKTIINQAVTKGINKNVKLKSSGINWLGDIPVHWEVKKLKYLVNEKLQYGANEPAIDDNKTQPRYIRITDFGEDGYLRNNTFKSLEYEKAKDYLLKEGDVLFARSGATVGKTFQFKAYKGIACFAGYLIKARPDTKQVLSDWIYIFTKSSLYEIWKNSIFIQATIQNIGADKYNQLIFPVPSIEEQTQIVRHIEKETERINKLITKTEKEITLLKEYRQALIFEAVTGKIDVRNETI